MHSSTSRVVCGAMLAVALANGGAGAQGPAGTDIHLVPLTIGDTSVHLGAPINITSRPGYDNQPSFTPDGRALFFTSVRADAQADIYRYDVAPRTTSRVTATAESEYSATVMPGGRRFSVIRVEADSTQRLWSFALDGTEPRVVLADVKPVGYHAWSDDSTVAVFVLGSPATLQIAKTHGGATAQVAGNIGRSLAQVPGSRSISFMRRSGSDWAIERHDPSRGQTETLGTGVPGAEYIAWLANGRLLTAAGNKLYFGVLESPGGQATIRWREVATFADPALQRLSRLAVSPDGRWLALVAAEPAR